MGMGRPQQGRGSHGGAAWPSDSLIAACMRSSMTGRNRGRLETHSRISLTVQIHVNYDLMDQSIQETTHFLLKERSYLDAGSYWFRLFTQWNTPPKLQPKLHPTKLRL